MNRTEIGRVGAKEALRFRHSLGISFDVPISIWDTAVAAGLKVKFVDVPSSEGFYAGGSSPVIVVTSHRPPGRQVTTGAHELGHHAFGHGFKVDELLVEGEDKHGHDEHERLADAFARNILMPSSAFRKALRDRDWDPASVTPARAYLLAEYFGVGYTTLLYHAASTLKVIGRPQLQRLIKHRPKDIQARLHEPSTRNGRVIPVDRHWGLRPIDVEVGDVILFGFEVTGTGPTVEPTTCRKMWAALRATQPGSAVVQARVGAWTRQIRVCKKGYVGRYKFRYLEDPEFGRDCK